MSSRLASAIAFVALCVPVVFPSPAVAQDEIYTAPVPNGYRIYLSPARHSDSGARGECLGTDENTMGYLNALDASNSNHFASDNLLERGYTTRVGNGTVSSAINNSNAWGADLHVVVHSNSKLTQNCPSTNASVYGTNVIYRSGSTRGQALASSLNSAIGPASPGTNDYICYNPGQPCTTIDLGELRETVAPAAYIEAEFHDWDRGANFLWNDWSWQWRIAYGIDSHLGFPR
jgi:N-acetylmuramoyl-L-alanine amidase